MKKRAKWWCLLVCVYVISSPLAGQAIENAPRISDREIIESLARLEVSVAANKEAITSLRTDMQTEIGSLRTEIGSLRTEMQTEIGSLRTEMQTEIGSLRTDMQTEIGSLRTEMQGGIGALRTEILSFLKWGFGLLFTSMFILVGFILWDRRSTVKPLKDELDELERRKVNRVIAALENLSKQDSKVAEALRSVGLL